MSWNSAFPHPKNPTVAITSFEVLVVAYQALYEPIIHLRPVLRPAR